MKLQWNGKKKINNKIREREREGVRETYVSFMKP